MNFFGRVQLLVNRLAIETHYPCRMEVVGTGKLGVRANPEVWVGKYWVQIDGEPVIRLVQENDLVCLC